MEKMSEQADYQQKMKVMESEEKSRKMQEKNAKLEKQRQLRECYEQAIVDRQNRKHLEKVNNNVKADEYKAYLDSQETKRQQNFQYQREKYNSPGKGLSAKSRLQNQENINGKQGELIRSTGLQVGEVQDRTKDEKREMMMKYHQQLDAQVQNNQQKKQEKKLTEDAQMRDSIDKQILLQNRFDEQRKQVDRNRKCLYRLNLNEQVDNRDKVKDNLQNSNYLLSDPVPPITKDMIQQSYPSKNEQYALAANVKERLKRGGNLNKDVIDLNTNSKDAYRDIKLKYGNHASKFNILTGE